MIGRGCGRDLAPGLGAGVVLGVALVVGNNRQKDMTRAGGVDSRGYLG